MRSGDYGVKILAVAMNNLEYHLHSVENVALAAWRYIQFSHTDAYHFSTR